MYTYTYVYMYIYTCIYIYIIYIYIYIYIYKPNCRILNIPASVCIECLISVTLKRFLIKFLMVATNES